MIAIAGGAYAFLNKDTLMAGLEEGMAEAAPVMDDAAEPADGEDKAAESEDAGDDA